MIMYKRALHHLWTSIRPIKVWYLLAACLLCIGIHVAALRHNNNTMAELRNAVYAADKNNGNVEEALQNLRKFVNQHMNTDLDTGTGVYPPVQLKYTYERLVQAEKDRVNAANTQVYTDAQRNCEKLYPGSFSGGPRVPCIEQYVKSHGTTASSVPDALYKFDFTSPGWSPDLAGWSLALGVVFLVLTVLRLGLGLLRK